MQKLAEVCIKRPIFAAMIVLALVVVGTASYLRLGVDRFPSVDLPTVRVSTTLPGASPAASPPTSARVSRRRSPSALKRRLIPLRALMSCALSLCKGCP